MPFFSKFGGGGSHRFGLTRGASAPLTAPTSLALVSRTTTSVTLSFTAPTNTGGLPITNYQFNIDGGSYTAFSPADAETPVTITGLTAGTSYTVTLKAVNAVGAGPASAGLSVTTAISYTVGYMVLAGGGGGNNPGGGGGGLRSTVTASGRGTAVETPLTVQSGPYTVTVGAGSAGLGNNSVFHTVTSLGGGAGSGSGGCGGGNSGAGTAGQGFDGGPAGTLSFGGGGGTGGGGGGGGNQVGGNGGGGTTVAISGSSITYGGGGGGGVYCCAGPAGPGGSGGSGGGGAGGATNGSGNPDGNNGGNGTNGLGGGGGGQKGPNISGLGGSGVVFIRYPDSLPNLSAITGLTKEGGGLTPTTTTGGFKIYKFTAGTGTVEFV